MMRVGDSQSGTLGSDYVLGRRWHNVPDTGRAYHTTCPPWAAQTLELSQLPLRLLRQPPEERDIFSEIKNCV